MKEIGTFKIDKNMCSNCREDEDCPQKYSANGNCVYSEKDLVKEQVPETFSDLLTLCKNKEGCFVLRAGDRQYIEVPTILTGYSFTFHENGNIFFYEDVCVKEKATPARQWQIIKNLIGE